MKKIKIFLASSNKLKEERQLFEAEIYRKSKKWIDKGIFLHLDIWEDLSAKMSELGHSQKDYNEVVKEADIVVLLAYTKVGMYTAEEFETAYGQFQKTKKPFIFTYFKPNPPFTGSNFKELESLNNFQSKLKELNHFCSFYENFDSLWNQFNKELDRLEEKEFEEMPKNSKNDRKDQSQNHSTVTGNNNTVIQGMSNSSYTDKSTHQNHSGEGDNVAGNKTSN